MNFQNKLLNYNIIKIYFKPKQTINIQSFCNLNYLFCSMVQNNL